MPNYEQDEEYMSIIKDILSVDEFRNLENIQHHEQTRLNHSLKVSYYAYRAAKKMGLHYDEVARAGLLHDFYLGQVNEQKNIKDRFLLFTTKHPQQAVYNSLKYFELTDKEIDIIRSHMFPVDIKIPKYAESWLVSIVDKIVSFNEFGYKFSNKLSWMINLYIVVILNYIRR